MKVRNENISFNFKAGLTNRMKRQISSCNVQKVSTEFSRCGIPTDFKDNKVIAWSSLKCLQIIQTLNSKYNLNLALPSGIFVEDFTDLDIPESQNILGFCTTMPKALLKNSKKIFPEKTIFFNWHPNEDCSDKDFFWNNINALADYKKEIGDSSTNHFLDIILHEFAHAIHIDHLLKKLGPVKYIKLLHKLKEIEETNSFKNKYLKTISNQSCLYAGTDPTECIACDISKRIIENLEEFKLRPTKNFIKESPYRKYNSKEKLISLIFDNKYDRLVRRFWNGDIK